MQFRNTVVDAGVRVASLDYLGQIASRLRKDTVSSQLDESSLDRIYIYLSSNEEVEKRGNFFEEFFFIFSSLNREFQRMKIGRRFCKED